MLSKMLILKRLHCLKWLLAVLVCGFALPAVSFGQDDDEPEPPPLLVVNLASVNRLRGDLELLLNAREPASGERLMSITMTGLRGLKGLDLDKPIALVATLEDFNLRGMLCVPVADTDALVRTITTESIEPRKLGPDEYYLKGLSAPVFVRVRNGYAYVSNSPRLVDAKWPGLIAGMKRLAERYDLAISSQAASLPAEARKTLSRALRASLEVELQRGDDESEMSHLLRSLVGQETLRLLELLVEADDVTLGWTIDGDPVNARAELVIDTPADSSLGEDLRGFLGTKQPRWTVGFGENQLLSAWMNVNLGTSEQTLMKRLQTTIAPTNATPERDEPTLGDIVRRAVTQGNVETAFQLRLIPKTTVIAIGAMRLPGIGGVSGEVNSLLEMLSNHPAIETIDIDFAEASATTLHRITLAAPLDTLLPDASADVKDWLGRLTTIYLGVGPDHVWVCLGRGEMLSPFRDAIRTAVEASTSEPDNAAAGDPVSLSVDLGEFVQLMRRSLPASVMELSLDATEGGDDAIRGEIRRSTRGAKGKVQVESGSLRLITDLIRLGLSPASAPPNPEK